MLIVMEGLRLESHGFRYKVALYLSYLHVKFDKVILCVRFYDGSWQT